MYKNVLCTKLEEPIAQSTVALQNMDASQKQYLAHSAIIAKKWNAELYMCSNKSSCTDPNMVGSISRAIYTK